MIVGALTEMILQNENLQGAEGMKRISVRIIQSLSDYPGNMELCQVDEAVIVGVQFLFTTSVVCMECVLLLKKSSGVLYAD